MESEPDYGAIRERHAWYRLAECDAEHVARLLRQGPEAFWVLMASKYLNEAPWNSDRRFREALRLLSVASSEGRKLRFAELGFGWGAVAGLAARMGHVAVGVDIEGPWIREAEVRFGFTGARFAGVGAAFFELDVRGARGDEVLRASSFDLVFSGDVIEHSAAPRAFLRCAARLVAPGGTLIVTTPAVDGDAWPSGPPPIHLTALPASLLSGEIERIWPGCVVRTWREDRGPAPESADRGARAPAARKPTLCVDPFSDEYYAAAARTPMRPTEGRISSERPTDADRALATSLLRGRRRLGTGTILVATRPAEGL